jgi:hypothetical protein
MKAILLAPFQLIKSIYLFFWNGWCASDNPQMEAITIAFAFFAAGLGLLVFIYVGAYVTNPAYKSVQQQHLAMPSYAPAPAPTLAPAFAPTAASTYAGSLAAGLHAESAPNVFGRPRVHHHEIMPPGRADAFTGQSEYIWR